MKLKHLLEGIECQVLGDAQTEIKGIAYDSRKVEEGYLFFCIKGYQSDGHQYEMCIRDRAERADSLSS